jgi:hypothetical protein
MGLGRAPLNSDRLFANGATRGSRSAGGRARHATKAVAFSSLSSAFRWPLEAMDRDYRREGASVRNLQLGTSAPPDSPAFDDLDAALEPERRQGASLVDTAILPESMTESIAARRRRRGLRRHDDVLATLTSVVTDKERNHAERSSARRDCRHPERGHLLAIANQQDIADQHRVVPGLGVEHGKPCDLGELVGRCRHQRQLALL